MPTVAELLRESSGRLAAITETPRLDAEILLSHAMSLSRARLLASLQDEASPGDFEVLLQRRLNAEPIAYILGEWEFYGLTLQIEPPVLQRDDQPHRLLPVAQKQALAVRTGKIAAQRP